MSDFAIISQDTFNDIQLDAGNILRDFDPTAPARPSDSDIIAVTTGGISVSCTPTYSDFGEDVDNCPNNTKELKHLDGWDCIMSFTDVRLNEDVVALSLGAATKTTVSAALSKIIPNADLDQDDFEDAIWWVGPRAGGGGAAVKLFNALSTGGFSLQTTKNGKGQVSMEITGHVSINDQETVPMEFYIFDAPSGATGATS